MPDMPDMPRYLFTLQLATMALLTAGVDTAIVAVAPI